jgi:hypothetical protein
MQQAISLPRPVVLQSPSSLWRNPVLSQYAWKWRRVETVAKLRISVTRVKQYTVYTVLTLVLLYCFTLNMLILSHIEWVMFHKYFHIIKDTWLP